MKENQRVTISVIIPEHESKYQTVKKSRKSGKPRFWTVNGQGLYNASMHYTLRAKMTRHFHRYLSKYIKNQISSQHIETINKEVYPESKRKLVISLDIYEIKRSKMPDVSNMWIWIKWFEDALQETGVIPDDNPDYVIESGRKRYHWVDNEIDRKLVFHIDFTTI